MKLTPNALGYALGQVEKRVQLLESRESELATDNTEILEAVNQLKDIIDNMLVKDNPNYRKKRVLDEMDGFLRNPIGRTRPLIEN